MMLLLVWTVRWMWLDSMDLFHSIDRFVALPPEQQQVGADH